MRTLLACWRLVRVVLHLLHGLWIIKARFPRLDGAGRHRRIQWWAGKFLSVLDVQLDLQGQFKPGSSLIVANHVSWLDIVAIHAVHPRTRFVSKADVKTWPIVGPLVHAADTLFIERERKRDAMRVVHQMAEALQAGDSVGIFPEGTTGAGDQLLPFHANLLQAAIAAEAAVQPVALRFSDAEGPISQAVVYVGDTTIVQSLWLIAMGRGLRVRVTVLPPVGARHADRRALSQHLQALITEALDR
nr:lysophospholipid acyltransferase family protein [uncultured Roseateles sp.]